MIDETHAPRLRSWVASANDPATEFPIQNLPFGRFRRVGTDQPLRIGCAIGSQVLDLKLALENSPWQPPMRALLEPLAAGDLNAFMASGPSARREVRIELSRALREGNDTAPFLELCVLPQSDIELVLPCRIGDYTDFYAGIHHATAVGRLFRPDAPLLPNYKWVPIGYHGRATSIGVSGQHFRRPNGQVKGQDEIPAFGPTRRLDYELELGALMGPGNHLGEPIALAEAEDQLFGLVLLNDWSARDIQAWEYQPLGPFLSKSFASTVSPWVVTMEALAPFRSPVSRPDGDPQPLPYLDSQDNRGRGALDIHLEVWLQTAAMRDAAAAPVRLSRSNFRDAYWTLAQLVTHHASNGCNLQSGDLLGTGTQSGPNEGEGGSLLELSGGGRRPLSLPNGETRAFLHDGDTVILRAYCQRDGFARIGFGDCAGTVGAAL
ncbi:MAG: fumarylacetoacetase [Rhizobacter sp.]